MSSSSLSAAADGMVTVVGGLVAVFPDRSVVTAGAAASRLAEPPTWHTQQTCVTYRLALDCAGHMGPLGLGERNTGG